MVNLNKLIKGFIYLVAADAVSPPDPPDVTSPTKESPPSKAEKRRMKEEMRKLLMKKMKVKQQKQDRRALKSFIIDSGATSHYARTSDNLPSIGPSNKQVMLPTGQIVDATEQVKLPFDIKDAARIAELVPAIKTSSLLSVGKLADAGYTSVFLPEDRGVAIIETSSGKTVLQG